MKKHLIVGLTGASGSIKSLGSVWDGTYAFSTLDRTVIEARGARHDVRNRSEGVEHA